jgi:non-ribosomal peptide synthetase component F
MQFHALTFDVSLEEMFPAWCAGATVVLRPPQVVADFEALESFIVERNVMRPDFG